MKIIFFSRLFYPHIGGVEKHVFEISKLLVKKGHKVTIVTERFDKNLKSRENIQGIKVYRIDVGKNDWFKKFRIWWQLLKLKGVVKGADIVHCHDVFFWYLPFRFLFFTKPAFTTFHGYETRFPPSRKAFFSRKIAEKLSNGNIIVGDYIRKWYETKPDYVTYGGVGVSSIKYQVLSKQKKRLRILFIGRLEEDTNILVYLESLKELKEKRVKFEFEAVGNGVYRKEAEKYGRVHGFVKNVQEYLRKADIVFASSYISILEAMSAGKLVFAVYNNTLKKDYLENSPFSKLMIVCASPWEVVDKLEYFLKKKEERSALEEKAYKFANKQTWDNVLKDYLDLWNPTSPRIRGTRV